MPLKQKMHIQVGIVRELWRFLVKLQPSLSLDEDTIKDLRYAAMLHDIGKIGISATILNKKIRSLTKSLRR